MNEGAEMQSLTHVVYRPFEDGGVIRQVHECVDATLWRWVRQLEGQGRITPIPATVTPVQTSDGRWWATQSAADRHDRELAKEAGHYPIKLDRGKYQLSDGTIVNGSKATAEAHEDELRLALKE